MFQTEKKWLSPPGPQAHSLPGDIPQPMVQVLLSRGIGTSENLHFFLGPPHRLPYDPLRLSGMEPALRRLYQAIERGERVGVFGDFDVDGITGAAIVAEGLNAFGVPWVPYIPHRVDEGHGLTIGAVRQLREKGVNLIVTVDCGISSVVEVSEARTLGIDVIITDHHTPSPNLPGAVSIINPRMSQDQYPFLGLSGAGLAFKLVQGLFQYYGQPWDKTLLELAALGTIADLVPLVDENRFLVSQGLRELSRTQRVGLQALYRWAGVRPESVDSETVSFQIIPRLNSSGRMSHAIDGFHLLTTRSATEAEALAGKLEGLNQERRHLTEQAFAIACEHLRGQDLLPPILLVEDQSITPGVAGLIAGRLVELYHRPAVVMAEIDSDHFTASARSIPEFNMVEAFTACQDLFVRFGGHSQAAGFTLRKDNISLLADRLTGIANERLSHCELQPTLQIDAELRLADITAELQGWLRQLGPFGPGNPQPKFLSRNVPVSEVQFVGQQGQHARLRLKEGTREWTALAFHQAERWSDYSPRIDLVYTITSDSWNGTERVTLKVLDARPSVV